MLRIPGPIRSMAAHSFAASLELNHDPARAPALPDAYAAEGTADALAVTAAHLARQADSVADYATGLFADVADTPDDVRRAQQEALAATRRAAGDMRHGHLALLELRDALAALPVTGGEPEERPRSSLASAAQVVMAALTDDTAALEELVRGADEDTLRHLERAVQAVRRAVAARDAPRRGTLT